MSTWTTKAGDYHRRIRLTLTDLTTTGASGVTFKLRPQQGGAVVTRSGVIDSATQVSCQFQEPDLDTPGVYSLEAVLQYVDGTETAPTTGYVTVVVEQKL